MSVSGGTKEHGCFCLLSSDSVKTQRSNKRYCENIKYWNILVKANSADLDQIAPEGLV